MVFRRILTVDKRQASITQYLTNVFPQSDFHIIFDWRLTIVRFLSNFEFQFYGQAFCLFVGKAIMKKVGAVLVFVFWVAMEVFAGPGKKQLTLRFRDLSSNLYDITHIYLDMGRSTLFNPTIPPPPQPEDVAKQPDTSWAMPQIYSFSSDGIACYSNGYGPFDSTKVIRLGIRVAGGTSYSISAQLVDNFDPTSIILIEDRLNGVFKDLRRGDFVVNLAQQQTTEDRFYIHISYPPVIDLTLSGCDDNDGIITVTQDTFITWNSCQLLDSALTFITSYSNIKGNMTFTDLPSGMYNLAFLYGQHAALKTIFLNTHKIQTSASASKIYAEVNEIVNFYSSAVNATFYNWDFGDGTVINGIANPQVSWPQPGVYTVTLHCSNAFGCDAYDYLTIYVGQSSSVEENRIELANITILNKHLLFEAKGNSSQPLRYEVYQITGQQIISGTMGGSNASIDLSSRPSGIYVVRLQAGGGSLSRKFFLE